MRDHSEIVWQLACLAKAGYIASRMRTAQNRQKGTTEIPSKRLIIDLMKSFSQLLLDEGIEMDVESQRAWDFFETLDGQAQSRILEHFSHYVDVMKDIRDQGIRLNDTRQSLWRVYKNNRWVPEGGLFSEISDSDVVEIYMPDQTQIYRNSKYFKYTSYSLSDLVFFPWHDLVEHGPSVTEELLTVGKKIFVDQAPAESKFTLTPYVAKEKYSPGKYEAHLENKFICPIRGRESRQNEAALVVWNIKILNNSKNILKPEHQLLISKETELT